MKKSRLYWTKERCHEEALKYATYKEFQYNSGGAYSSACTHGWLDEIQSHLTRNRKPNNYWTKEKCHEEALKYETRNMFSRMSCGAYTASRKNCWIEDVCSHMTSNGNLLKRFIYSFEFSDNHVYVGLTYDINIRKNLHLGLSNSLTQSKKSQVFRHIEKNWINTKIKYTNRKFYQ